MKQYVLIILFLVITFVLNAQTLHIEFDNIRNNKGEISVSIYEDADTWLDEDIKKYSFYKEYVSDGKMTATIDLERPGKYAVAVLDDEDANGKMNHNFIGYPKEGFGFSNNIHVWLSRPKFEECVLDIKNDTTIQISLQYK
jgi:uncharacterized protein (DUF2141 family)